jgi:uncharacterized membrane protein YoaK (UPF0700 family)
MQQSMQNASNAAPVDARAGLERAEESLRVAVVLSVAGGFLDAFTWIAHHGVMANAQTANVVLLAVYAAMGQWEEALRRVPPIAAFLVGVLIVCRLRAGANDEGKYHLAMVTLVIEGLVLAVVMALHVRLPEVAGTLGISFAAAMQTASFARVEGRNYSSVMVTGNLRYAMETFFSGYVEKHDPVALRQSRTLIMVCLTFALGAALGAVLTKTIGSRALLVPLALLVVALVLCTRSRVRWSIFRWD